MFGFRLSQLYQHSTEIQSAQSIGAGRLEDANGIYCGRDLNCGSMCTLSVYKSTDTLVSA